MNSIQEPRRTNAHMRRVLEDYETGRRQKHLTDLQGWDWLRIACWASALLCSLAIWRALYVIARWIF